jgi:hypothetical protein
MNEYGTRMLQRLGMSYSRWPSGKGDFGNLPCLKVPALREVTQNECGNLPGPSPTGELTENPTLNGTDRISMSAFDHVLTEIR